MFEGSIETRAKRPVIEKKIEPPGMVIRIAGSAKEDHARKRTQNPENFGEFGQDGYAVGKNGDSLFVFDGISTYRESYPFGLAIAQQLAEERAMILDSIDDSREMAAIKFMLQGSIREAIGERQGGVVFSGFIRLSETKILIVKIGDCPVILRKKDDTARELMPSENKSMQTSGLDHQIMPEDYDLQFEIVDIEAGDKLIIASDGILTKVARSSGIEALKRFGNEADPRSIVDQVIQSTPVRADQDDVIVAEVIFTDGSKQVLQQAA
jgi:serine/threonine protein phosphatase PrpC